MIISICLKWFFLFSAHRIIAHHGKPPLTYQAYIKVADSIGVPPKPVDSPKTLKELVQDRGRKINNPIIYEFDYLKIIKIIFLLQEFLHMPFYSFKKLFIFIFFVNLRFMFLCLKWRATVFAFVFFIFFWSNNNIQKWVAIKFYIFFYPHLLIPMLMNYIQYQCNELNVLLKYHINVKCFPFLYRYL